MKRALAHGRSGRRAWTVAALLLAWSTASAAPGMVAEYQVIRAAGEAGAERLLARGDRLRIDDGDDGGDYLLFDAGAMTVFSVRHRTRTVLAIDTPPAAEVSPPMALERSTIAQPEDAGAPRVGGVMPRRVALRVNGRACAGVVGLPGVLPRLTALWERFAELLAARHRSVLHTVPADLHDPCDLALNVFHPTWWLEQGLPVLTLGPGLPERRLVRYEREVDLPDGLFDLPAGYPRSRLPGG